MNFNDHLDKQLISMLYPLSINVITNPFPRSYETPPKPTPGFFLGISTLGPSLNGVFNMRNMNGGWDYYLTSHMGMDQYLLIPFLGG